MFDRNKIGYNFVFMFASPAYIPVKHRSGFERINLDPLSYREEYHRIKQSIKTSKIKITVHKVHGTPENLRQTLHKQRPGAIHFSGHGETAENIR